MVEPDYKTEIVQICKKISEYNLDEIKATLGKFDFKADVFTDIRFITHQVVHIKSIEDIPSGVVNFKGIARELRELDKNLNILKTGDKNDIEPNIKSITNNTKDNKDRLLNYRFLNYKEPELIQPTVVPPNKQLLENEGNLAYDVFICHATEDKSDFVEPLVNLLVKNGLKVWYDNFELKIGDSLSSSINEGLVKSKYGVVVFSPSFLKKSFPQQELAGLFAKERLDKKVILPVWHKITRKELEETYPIIVDKVAANSDDGVKNVAKKILETVKPITNSQESQITLSNQGDNEKPKKGGVIDWAKRNPKWIAVFFTILLGLWFTYESLKIQRESNIPTNPFLKFSTKDKIPALSAQALAREGGILGASFPICIKNGGEHKTGDINFNLITSLQSNFKSSGNHIQNLDGLERKCEAMWLWQNGCDLTPIGNCNKTLVPKGKVSLTLWFECNNCEPTKGNETFEVCVWHNSGDECD